jgi:hypothetical protein
MQRDFGNELIVAIVAVALVAFAITFGILLSVSSTPESEEATQTSVAQVPDTVEPTVTNTEEPTITNTAEPTSTHTLVPSETPTIPMPTDTAIPPTSTLAPTETPIPPSKTPIPSATPTLTPSETETPMPSATLTSTSTATKTATLVPPTETLQPIDTSTPIPTATDPPPTPTPTPLPPTATETETPIVIMEDSSLGILPTPTGADVSIPSSVDSDCAPPEEWSAYVVEPRTTLFTIAQAVDSTVAELRTANCLENADRIGIGQVLYVPQLPVEPVATFVSANATDTSGGEGTSPVGCANPSASISSPVPGQVIESAYPIMGSAVIEDFLYYKLEIRPYGAPTYTFYARSDTAVSNGILGHLDPTAFPIGDYWVRLVVFDKNDAVPTDATCAISVRFE